MLCPSHNLETIYFINFHLHTVPRDGSPAEAAFQYFFTYYDHLAEGTNRAVILHVPVRLTQPSHSVQMQGVLTRLAVKVARYTESCFDFV